MVGQSRRGWIRDTVFSPDLVVIAAAQNQIESRRKGDHCGITSANFFLKLEASIKSVVTRADEYDKPVSYLGRTVSPEYYFGISNLEIRGQHPV